MLPQRNVTSRVSFPLHGTGGHLSRTFVWFRRPFADNTLEAGLLRADRCRKTKSRAPEAIDKRNILLMSSPFDRVATAKAALLMTGSTYVSFFFGLIVSAVVARSIGPADFGRYAYVVWISGILVQFANNGLNTTGIRFISENLGRNDRQTASDVHGWLLCRQYVCLAIASVGFLAGMPWMLPSGWNAHIALFGGVVLVSLISKALYLFDVSVAKGYGEYSVEAVSNTSITAVNLMLALVLYAFDAPLASYLALFALTSIAYGVSTWFLLRGRGISRTVATLEPGMETRLRQHLVWTVVLTLAAALGNKASETYLLSTYGSPAEIGFFAIATALTRGGVELLSAGLNTVLMPLMGHAYGAGGTQRVNDILGHSTRYYGFAGLLLAGVGFFWAGPAIVLMYGAQYQAAVPVFKVMVIVAGVTLSQGAFGALLSTRPPDAIPMSACQALHKSLSG